MADWLVKHLFDCLMSVGVVVHLGLTIWDSDYSYIKNSGKKDHHNVGDLMIIQLQLYFVY